MLYSEPGQYSKKESTDFHKGAITNVRQIRGYEGIHVSDDSNDVLIIGSGYDSQLISAVANAKDHAQKIQVLGFPSLRPDMYQENVLRCVRAENELGADPLTRPHFAPANDPFVTASKISQIVKKLDEIKPITNLYLAPLSTKSQTIGFLLYYISELVGTNASVLYPMHDQYERETSMGMTRVWKYEIEFTD